MDIKEFKNKVLEPMWDDKESQLRHNEYNSKEEELELQAEVYLLWHLMDLIDTL